MPLFILHIIGRFIRVETDVDAIAITVDFTHIVGVIYVFGGIFPRLISAVDDRSISV